MEHMNDPIKDYCKKKGFADFVVEGGLDYLVPSWERTVAHIARDYARMMKEEYLNDNGWETNSVGEARQELGQVIEDVYHQKWLHSGLGYLPPVEYESLYTAVEKHPSSLVRCIGFTPSPSP